jgi:hypothetical protein
MSIPRVVPLVTISALLCAAPLFGQSDKPKPPKKGDVLVIRGCLRGSAVEAAEAMRVDAEGERRLDETVPVLTYRLEGKKDLLKDLKSKHDKRIVEVTGVLRSELSGNGLGGVVGRTRISIGVDPRTGRTPQGTDQAVPVLEATSFEGSTTSCAR